MEIEKFTQLVKDPNLLDNSTLHKLKDILKRYPYFHTAQILYLKDILKTRPNAFYEMRKEVAPHIQDKAKLFDFLHDLAPAPSAAGEGKAPEATKKAESKQQKDASTSGETADIKPEAASEEKTQEADFTPTRETEATRQETETARSEKSAQESPESSQKEAEAETERNEINFDDILNTDTVTAEAGKKQEEKEKMPDVPEETEDEGSLANTFQEGWKQLTSKLSGLWDQEEPEKKEEVEKEDNEFQEGWNELVNKIKQGWETSTSYLEYALEEKSELFKEGWNKGLDKLHEIWQKHFNELEKEQESKDEQFKQGWKKAEATIVQDKENKKFTVSTQAEGIKEIKQQIGKLAEKVRKSSSISGKPEDYKAGWSKALELLESTKSINLNKLSEQNTDIKNESREFIKGWNDVIDAFQYQWLKHFHPDAKHKRSKEYIEGWKKLEAHIKNMEKATLPETAEKTEKPAEESQDDGIKAVKQQIGRIAEKARETGSLSGKGEDYKDGWNHALELLESAETKNLSKLANKEVTLKNKSGAYLSGWNDAIDQFQYQWVTHFNPDEAHNRTDAFMEGWKQMETYIKNMEKAPLPETSEETQDKQTVKSPEEQTGHTKTKEPATTEKAGSKKSSETRKQESTKSQEDTEKKKSGQKQTKKTEKSTEKSGQSTAADAILEKINRIKQSRDQLDELENKQEQTNTEQDKKKKDGN